MMMATASRNTDTESGPDYICTLFSREIALPIFGQEMMEMRLLYRDWGPS